MDSVFFSLTTVAAIAVLIVLVFGLYTLLKGDSGNLSQKLMRWRIGLQFLAIVLVMGYVFLTR